MPEIPILLAVTVIAALVFDYTNGAHDAANAIATVVSTKVISPKTAVLMATALNLLGALTGGKVAATMGKGLVEPQVVAGCQTIVLAAVAGGISWNVITWWLGLPSSSSHALIGGLIGAAVAHGGWGVVLYRSFVLKVLLPLALSPLLGFLLGYALFLALVWLTWRRSPGPCHALFRRLQVISACFMALSHGSNDAQKTMGIITLSLFSYGLIESISVPFWVQLACALAISLGTANGGWKIIRTMGHRICKLEPVHGFAAETAAASAIFGASALGAPISTTHVISASIMGVGSVRRLTAVRWNVAGHMLMAWISTIPAAAAIGAGTFLMLKLLGVGSP
jgi:PiT family inorganic phosphate transporter